MKDWAREYPHLAMEAYSREGWLDTAARIEQERGLTDAERVEVDRAWRDFVALMGDLAKILRGIAS